MEWFFSLLAARCLFCSRRLLRFERMCTECSVRFAAREEAKVLSVAIDGLDVVALGLYDDELRSLILRSKQAPAQSVVRWFAQALQKKIPPEWRKLPLIWVPGAPLRPIHLVEAVGLELSRLGQPLVPRPWLSRRLRPAKSQKTLRVDARKSRDLTQVYRISSRTNLGRNSFQEALLFDDVVTTGSTLLACKNLLEKEHPEVKIRGALALAYTEKTSSKEQLESSAVYRDLHNARLPSGREARPSF